MAKVSVVMPIYNADRYLEKAITALVKQTYKDTDIILVDDGSTDRSPAIIERMMNKREHIKMCSQPHSGIARARNLGLKLSNSEYVTFVDADDWVEPDFVEKHLKVLETGYTSRFMRTIDCSVASGFYITVAERRENKKTKSRKAASFQKSSCLVKALKNGFLKKE